MGLQPASVRVCALTISNMNTYKTRRCMKFYLRHHCGRGKAAFGFKLDRIRTPVSMATDSFYRAIMGRTVLSLFLSCF